MHFNSIKVRLKLYFLILLKITYKQFQFHKGTIKTSNHPPSTEAREGFQFHKGTIKTMLRAGYIESIRPFQFHKGTIKTESKNLMDLLYRISIP